MAYQIKYAYTCHIGKIRNNNEDNFWCCGEFLNAQNQGMSHIQSGCRKQSELPVMAVFDGMGGESCGEMAAFPVDCIIKNKKTVYVEMESSFYLRPVKK